MGWSGNFGVQYRCENGISLFYGQLKVSSALDRKPGSGWTRIKQGGVPLSASDSVGISLVLDGVDGPPSSLRW